MKAIRREPKNGLGTFGSIHNGIQKEAWAIYKSIEFRPEHFKDYLINEVGFERCECLGESETEKKG